MSIIKWYKRDPNAALNGMMILSLEERGAYNTILDLIYSHDGNLPDDDRFICGWLKCDMRVWKRLKNRLIETGKIGIESGLIANLRATCEIDEALGRVASAVELGRINGIKSGISRRKNKGLGEPNLEGLANTSTPTPTIVRENFLLKEGRKDTMSGSIALDENSEAFKAWEAYTRATTGRGCPRATIRPEGARPFTGWYFKTEWPPNLMKRTA